MSDEIKDNVVSLNGGVPQSDRKKEFMTIVGDQFDRLFAEEGVEPDTLLTSMCYMADDMASNVGVKCCGDAEQYTGSALAKALVYLQRTISDEL